MNMSQVLNIQDILQAIPHRYPILLVDRVTILESGSKAIGHKCVSANEPFFQGHFPGRPIMPGVLIVESMAQTACTMFLSKPELKNKLAFFMSIDGVKFRKPVIPGDILELHIEVLRSGSRAGKVKGEAKVSQEVVAEATFTFALVDNKEQ